jgi:chlorophyll synthase
VVTQFLALLAGGLGTAALLDVWAGHETPILFGLAVFGSFISYIYRCDDSQGWQRGCSGRDSGDMARRIGTAAAAVGTWPGQGGSVTRRCDGGSGGCG